jgi:hypothetical protein
MVERYISRDVLLNKLASMKYQEVSELQVHNIFVDLGYIDQDSYMYVEDNVNNNEQNEA